MGQIKAQVAALLMQRVSHQDIADRLGIAKGTVQNYKDTILAEWRESSAADADELFTTIFAEYAHDRNEALAAWEKSKLNKETEIVKDGKDGAETTNKTEGQCGDPALLAAAMRALDSMRELRGLDPPKRTENTNRNLNTEMPEATRELMADPGVRKALLLAERAAEDRRNAAGP